MTLTAKEQRRLMVLNRVLAGQLTAGAAATLLDLSERQVRRLLAAYREVGVAALAHGNRGRSPIHATSTAVRQQVIALATGKYAGCNHQHLSELLHTEGIHLSRATVRRILTAAGQPSPRQRRTPKHRRRRARYPQEGMLVQADGSRHRWLEDRGPELTLIAMVDDATGKVLGACFRDQEDAHGYFLVLREVVTTYGCPLALYHDRHGIFERTASERETLAEQLAGKPEPTQFGRLLEELAIASIPAHSPQAKGRIERLFGTFQDRLVVELRLANATTREEANTVLATFLPRFNAQFAVEPTVPGVAYRPVPPDRPLDEMFCFKYVRSVAADNTVHFGGHCIQILPSTQRASYARARVEVQERLNGSVAVYHDGRCLAITEAPQEAPTLRARTGARGAARQPSTVRASTALHEEAGPARSEATGKHVNPTASPRWTPPPDHPWRKSFQRPRVTKSLTA